ncbi:hypothetical protein ACVWZT_003495 [Pseudomonas sp. TE21394]
MGKAWFAPAVYERPCVAKGPQSGPVDLRIDR